MFPKLRIMSFIGNPYAIEDDDIKNKYSFKLLGGHLKLDDIRIFRGKNELEDQQ